MRRTERRTLASWIAREHEVVVFPTPPLPPTKTQRRVFWSRIDWRVGSRASESVLMTAVDMVAVGRRIQRRGVSTGGGGFMRGSNDRVKIFCLPPPSLFLEVWFASA